MSENNMSTVVNIRISSSLRNKLNAYLDETNQGISEFVRSRISEYLDENFTTMPFPGSERPQDFFSNYLLKLQDMRKFAEENRRSVSTIPFASLYSLSDEEIREERDCDKEKLIQMIRQMHNIVNNMIMCYERVFDMAVDGAKYSIVLDKKLNNITTNIHEIFRQQDSKDFSEIFNGSPQTYMSRIMPTC